MKILFLLTQLESGGAQTRVIQTVDQLRSLGHSVDLAFLYKKRECFENVPKVILSKRGGFIRPLEAIINLFKLVRSRRYDSIVTNTAPANIIGNSVAWLCGVPSRVAYQTQPPQRLFRPYRFLDLILGSIGIYRKNIVNSEWTAACFDKYPQAYRSRLCLVYDGIVPPPAVVSKQEAREILGLPKDEYLILNIGRLSVQKDQATLIQAMEGVKGQLLIAGDGELRQELSALANHHAPGRVLFLGELPRERLGLYLAATDTFAFSSRWETFGLALIEAASYGLPLIVTDLPVSREVLRVNSESSREPISCVFVEPGDVGAFTRGLNSVRTVARELHRSPEPRLCPTFTIQHHTNQLVDVCTAAAFD